MTDKALARLTLPKSIPLDEQAGYLAPKLEFIGLSQRHQFCGAAFADMIESRLSFRNAMQDSDIQPAHMSPLKTVHLNLDGYSGELCLSTLSRLRNCARGGLDVRRVG
jgi:hypothetical protein